MSGQLGASSVKAVVVDDAPQDLVIAKRVLEKAGIIEVVTCWSVNSLEMSIDSGKVVPSAVQLWISDFSLDRGETGQDVFDLIFSRITPEERSSFTFVLNSYSSERDAHIQMALNELRRKANVTFIDKGELFTELPVFLKERGLGK